MKIDEQLARNLDYCLDTAEIKREDAMVIDGLLNEREVAELLGVSISTLRIDRMRARRIPFVKIGRCVRYRPVDIQAVIESGRVAGPLEPAGAANV